MRSLILILSFGVLASITACHPENLLGPSGPLAMTTGSRSGEALQQKECAAVYVTNMIPLYNRQGKAVSPAVIYSWIWQTVFNPSGAPLADPDQEHMDSIKYGETTRLSLLYPQVPDPKPATTKHQYTPVGGETFTYEFSYISIANGSTGDAVSPSNNDVFLTYQGSKQLPCNGVYTITFSISSGNRISADVRGHVFDNRKDFEDASQKLVLMPITHPVDTLSLARKAVRHEVPSEAELQVYAKDTKLPRQLVDTLADAYRSAIGR